MFTRRAFLAAIGSVAVAGYRPRTKPMRGATETGVRLSAPLTHSDWVLKEGIPRGEAGVRHMLDACKACGWSRIYWRVLDAGRSLYRSKLMEPMGMPEKANYFQPATDAERVWTASMSEEQRADLLRKIATRYDYDRFDPLAAAVRYGHEIGIEIHAWLSINEDDHAWGWPSRFTTKHPEFRWCRRDGAAYRSQLSFAFPEVRDCKLAIVAEVLKGYAVDGIFLDWLRTGDVRDNPQTDADGVANYGYEAPLVERFRKRYGVDPHELANGDERWVRMRTEPITAFMRSVRSLLRKRKPRLPLAVLVAHPWCYRGHQDKIDGNARGMLLDVGAWAREGLIDAAVPAGYHRDGGTPEQAYEALKKETEGKADVWLYGWVPGTVDAVEQEFARATKLGAKQILFWEADTIDARANREELQAAMRERAGGLRTRPE